MMAAQQQFDFTKDYRAKVRKVVFTIWQPEINTGFPWCVVFEGYSTGKGDVTIYHSCIPKGKVTFPNLKLPSARRFADFVVTMIGVYKGFGGNIIVRPQDYKALLDGYGEGVKQQYPGNNQS